MAEYVDRQEVLDALQAPEMFGITPYHIELIKRIPTADVAPVVHGNWRSNGIPDSMLSACSVCGFGCGAYSFRYCPNCGAKMDEEDIHE